MPDKIITVAICTYNRADCIAEAIQSSFGQKTSFEFDVLVVDNNSTDNTAEIVRELQQQYPELRYCVETQQGLSHSRNNALRNSITPYVIYIDDDCVVLDGWLENIVSGFSEANAAVVGGPISVGYPDVKPNWIPAKLESFLGDYYHGEEIKSVTHAFGGNIAVRRELAMEIGGFRADLGYQGNAKIAGEDTEFCYRARKAGYEVIYMPQARVIHNVQEARLNQKWFLAKAETTGITHAKTMNSLGELNEVAALYIQYNISLMAHKMLRQEDKAFDSKFRLTTSKSTLRTTCGDGFLGLVNVGLAMILSVPTLVVRSLGKILRR